MLKERFDSYAVSFHSFDETATLMYTDADGDQRNGVVQDAEGNDLSSFNIDVENASPPESKLKLVSGEAEDGLITLILMSS